MREVTDVCKAAMVSAAVLPADSRVRTDAMIEDRDSEVPPMFVTTSLACQRGVWKRTVSRAALEINKCGFQSAP